MDKNTYKNILSIAIPIILITGASTLLYSSTPNTNRISVEEAQSQVTITLNDQGFSPQETILKKGGTVTFKTEQEEYFWPASNVHPTHAIYSEFDPQKPISPKDTWTFTFEQVGTFRFHDHLSPEQTGTIFVVSENQTAQAPDCNNTTNLPLQQKEICWDWLLANAMDKDIDEAFDTFFSLYENDQEFAAKGCHWFAHRLGEQFYSQKYSSFQDIDPNDFPRESYICSYGFYHGWLEHLIRDNQNLTKATGLCEEMDRKLSDKLPGIRVNCYHAIGHGFISEPKTDEMWGDPQAIVEPALKACHTATSDPIALKECLEGAYNVIGYWWRLEDYGLTYPDTPQPLLDYCERQKENGNKAACHYELGMTFEKVLGDDLVAMSDYINQIEDDDIANNLIHVAAAGIMPRVAGTDNLSKYIPQCQAVPNRLQNRCILGLAGGVIAHTSPGEEYKQAITFCESTELTESQRQSCFEHISKNFSRMYTEQEKKSICRQIPSTFENTCLNQQ